MTDNGPENLTLRQLRMMDAKLDRIGEDVAELKRRATSLDERMALVHADMAGLSARMDRIESRLGHVERRLDLREAT